MGQGAAILPRRTSLLSMNEAGTWNPSKVVVTGNAVFHRCDQLVLGKARGGEGCESVLTPSFPFDLGKCSFVCNKGRVAERATLGRLDMGGY